MQTDVHAAWIKRLAHALAAEVIETHISWVLLTATDAYKVKKPVHLPFVNYATRQARRHFCEEEVRLNRRLAPSLYLGVARIAGTQQAPVLNGPGPALDHAVHMRRFPPGALFSEQLQGGALSSAAVDQLAGLLADFHRHALQAEPESGWGNPEQRRTAAMAALDGVRTLAGPAQCVQLQGWLENEAAALWPLWTCRQQAGFIRECHGDLHLDNIVRLDGQVAAFDGIEFDPALRWIDVLDDIAFAVMDFSAHGRRDFAFRLLNQWLDLTGDHAGLTALRFSVVYRALVRAQVALLRGAGHAAAAHRYLATALAWTQPVHPRLVITHGLPGSGKTFESQRLLEQEGAIRLRSDVERKRLFGLAMLESSKSKGLDLYGPDAGDRTYAHLLSTARVALQAGYTVILDAAFLRRVERLQALALARELDLPFAILHCEAPEPVLRERLLTRRGDASEAGIAVLDHLRLAMEPLGKDELQWVAGKACQTGQERA